MIVRAPRFLAWKARLAGLDPAQVYATNIFGVIIVGDQTGTDAVRAILHERIHNAQRRELLWFGYEPVFWGLYLWGRIIKRRSAEDAYGLHPMEAEAFYGMYQPDYLETRKRLGWWTV